jgi:hypothetical protein
MSFNDYATCTPNTIEHWIETLLYNIFGNNYHKSTIYTYTWTFIAVEKSSNNSIN